MKQIVQFIAVAFVAINLVSCSCGSSTPRYEKTPVDNLVRDMSNIKPFSIILYDMDANEGYPESYKHKYKVIKEVNGKPTEEITPWYEVSERFFAQHQNNMGMTIASKDSTGKLNKTPAPAGYSNYVGNQRYGHWERRSDGTSFWQFYGQYAFMRDMLGMGRSTHIYHHNYDNFRSSYSSGRAYYGPRSSTGTYTYGTRGTATSANYKNSTWSQKPATFKQSVRSKVSRSSTSGSRTSRTSSRYGSSGRSSGGGFGK